MDHGWPCFQQPTGLHLAADARRDPAGRAWRLRERGARGAKGDKGKALGPYQIWNIYWQDAAVPGREYREVLHDKKLSELVVERYMQRYARGSLRRLQRGTGTLKDVEVVARIHNGGPKGHRRESTLGYWSKARKEVRND